VGQKPHVDYEAIAASYAAHRSASPWVVEHLAGRLSRHGVASLLEMGCGTADYLAALTRRFSAAGFGFDKSPQMLEQAHRKNPGLTLKQGDAGGRFPFDDDCFDAAFCVNLVHYLSDLRNLFNEAYRVTKPGGTMVAVTQCKDAIRQRTMSRYFPETVQLELVRYPAMGQLRSRMEAAGWAAIEETRTDGTFPLDESMLAQFQNKAFSALRLIPQRCFEAGMASLAADLAAGQIVMREAFTYIWGTKRRLQ
jgi:SAM-dependent methyltransferase